MKKVCLHILFLVVSLFPVNAQIYDAEDNHLDSLLRIANTPNIDTTKLHWLNLLCYEHYNVDTVYKYANIELDMARELDNTLYEIRALSLLYWCNYHFGDFVKANTYAYRAIVMCDSIGNTYFAAKNYSNLGITFSAMQDANKSNEYFHKALELYTQRHDTAYMAETLRDIAYNDYTHRMFDEAEDCYKRALTLDKLLGDSASIAEDHMGLAAAYFYRYNYNTPVNDSIQILLKAKEEYLKAYEITKRTKDSYTDFFYTVEMPSVLLTEIQTGYHSEQRNKEILDSCKTLIDQAYRIAEKDGYDTDRFMIDFAYASYLTYSKQYRKAQNMLDSLKNVFETDIEAYKGQLHKLYNAYSSLYQEKGDFKTALKCQDKYHYYFEQSHNQDYAITATQNMVKANFEEQIREQDKRALILENQAKQQTVITWATVIVLIMLTFLTIVILYYFHQSRKINKALDKKNTEVTDSINYASLIQRAAMPSKKMMSDIFSEYMVIFRPLNIISGDFFWVSQKGRFKALAVGDCTGHGVPGAFLSMLGMSILEYISQRHNDNGPSAGNMLDDMRAVFKHSLHQYGNENDNHDGIDIALVIIDTEEYKLYYSGAFRPLIVIRGNEVIKCNADRMPIGEYHNELEHFTNHVIDIKKGDTLYLYSDGITDQFGYDQNHEVHKYTFKRFKELLIHIADMPLSKQKTIIENSINQWRTDNLVDDNGYPILYEQTDDTTLVAVRID